VVTDVAVGIRIRVALLRGGLPKEGDVAEVGFAGVNRSRLRLGDGGRDEGFFDGVGANAVIDFCESALEAPAELEAVVFVVLESLEFLDEVELALDHNPRGEFKRDVFVREGAAVAAGFRNQTNGSCRIDPAIGGEDETIESCLLFNRVDWRD